MEKAAGRPVPSVVDMFCGAGGLPYGFVKAGIRAAAGIDTDESRRYPFESNARSRSVCISVEGVSPRELARLYVGRGRRVLVECSPCRPLSSYNRSRAADPKWSLPNAFMRIVRGTCPCAASLEGVPSLPPHAVPEKFAGRLGGEGYRVWHGVARCANHGVSLTRRRLVPLASRPGNTGIIAWLRGGGPRTVRDAMGDLDPVRAGCLSSGNPLRRPRRLSSANPAHRPQARPGGGRMDREMRLILPYGKKQGKPHCGVHGRMPWDMPPPTLDTQAATWVTRRSGHPEQDGGPSLGVAMPIRTPPRGCRLADVKPHMRSGKTARRAKNAVPVALGKAIAPNIKRHLVDHDGRV